MILRITEISSDESQEIYNLEFGSDIEAFDPQSKQSSPCVKIVCSSGDESILFFGTDNSASLFSMTRKPVLAFRGFDNHSLSIKITYDGEYKIIYPKATTQQNNIITWNCTVLKSNMAEVAGRNYPYLFWDGISNFGKNIALDTGFCIHRDSVIGFLEEKCKIFGFDEQLTTDFVTFWAIYLQQNEFSLIYFLSTGECNRLAKLEIESGSKLQIVRMYMAFQGVSHQIELPEQDLEIIIKSDLPTVFDWGGFEVK